MNFTAKKIGPIGEYDTKYGQRYWGHVEESDMEVSFNLMSPVNIDEGVKLEFEEKTIKETKGSPEKPSREYLFLKKVKASGATAPPKQTSIDTDLSQKLDAIAGDVKLMLSFMRQVQKKLESPLDAVVDVDENEEINLQDIPF